MTEPQDIEVIDHIWIPMPDGVQLAARLWRPLSAQNVPVPVSVEKKGPTREEIFNLKQKREKMLLASRREMLEYEKHLNEEGNDFIDDCFDEVEGAFLLGLSLGAVARTVFTG